MGAYITQTHVDEEEGEGEEGLEQPGEREEPEELKEAEREDSFDDQVSVTSSEESMPKDTILSVRSVEGKLIKRDVIFLMRLLECAARESYS